MHDQAFRFAEGVVPQTQFG